MAKSILERAEAKLYKELEDIYGPAESEQEKTAQAKRFSKTEEVLRELMSKGTKSFSRNPIELKEAVHSADFRVLFPRIVTDVLQAPKEPIFIGQGLLARTVQVEGARVMEFPTFGAIRAFELGDTQEPPEQDPSFSKNITEIKVRRFGLKLEVSQDVIDESQWDILALYTQAAGDAMLRKKEELIFNEYELRAVTLFDNGIVPTTNIKNTTGKASNGTTANGTFDHADLLDMMAALGTNGYVPTDVVLHPLAWAIWAKDPFLRYQLLHKGGVGQTFGNFGIEAGDIQPYMPFGLNVVVSPFQTINYNTTLSVGVTGQGAGNYTTITVVDRNASILILQKTPMSMVEWENPARDIRNMMFHEKYGLALLNGGRSAVTAKNVRIDTNFQPVYTVREVTAA